MRERDPGEPARKPRGMGRRVDRGEGLLVAQVAEPRRAGVAAARARSGPGPRVRRQRRAVARRSSAFVFLALFGPLVILLAVLVQRLEHPRLPARRASPSTWYTDALHDTLLREALVNSTVGRVHRRARSAWSSARSPRSGSTRFRFRGRGAVGAARRRPADPAVAGDRDRRVDGVTARANIDLSLRDRDRHADDLHVPIGDGDRVGAALPVPARRRRRPRSIWAARGSRSCGT